MGMNTSKLFSYHGDLENKSKTSQITPEKQPCTPIMTRKVTDDPRSATMGIMRTPIEVVSTPTGVTRAIPQYLETDIDAVMPKMTAIQDPRSPNITHERTPIVVKLLLHGVSPAVRGTDVPAADTPNNSSSGLDPRSPATNFDRTPILKPKSPNHNASNTEEHLVERHSLSTNLHMSYCETTTDYSIPEIQALPEIVARKPLKFEKRLAECDQSDDSNSSSSTESSFEGSEADEQVTIIPNLKALEKIKVTDQDHQAIRIWRDSFSPKPMDTGKTEQYGNSEEIIIEFDDEQSIPKLPNVAVKTGEGQADCMPVSKQLKKIQHMNKDSKPSEDTRDNSADGIITDPQPRTPLGNRSNNHKLNVATKSPQQILRHKALSALKHQENTPPRVKQYKSKSKSNYTQWDLERTVII